LPAFGLRQPTKPARRGGTGSSTRIQKVFSGGVANLQDHCVRLPHWTKSFGRASRNLVGKVEFAEPVLPLEKTPFHCALSVVAHGTTHERGEVQVTLYYQRIPPYYLRQRAEDANRRDTARQIKFINELDVNKCAEIYNWKLEIASSGTADLQ
jgi:hypothetical protein